MNDVDILNVYKEYKRIYNDIDYPELNNDNLKYVKNKKYFLEFNSEELYNNIYNLKIDISIKKFQKDYIHALLFHEFTHLYDSIKYKNLDYNIYLLVMGGYSEMHGAFVMLNDLIKDENVNAFTHFSYKNSYTTILQFYNEKYMEIEKIWSNKNIIDANIFMDNMMKLCYFIGYYKYLKNKISYIKPFDIQSEFQPEINEMTNKFLNNDISLYKEYSDMIIKSKKIYINQYIQSISKVIKNHEIIEEIKKRLNEKL